MLACGRSTRNASGGRAVFADALVADAALSVSLRRWPAPASWRASNRLTMMALAIDVVAHDRGAVPGERRAGRHPDADVGRSLPAGRRAIVILAIVIDRITQAYGQPRRRRHACAQEGNERATMHILIQSPESGAMKIQIKDVTRGSQRSEGGR